MEKFSQLPVPHRKSSSIDESRSLDADLAGINGSRALELTRGSRASSSRPISSSCSSPSASGSRSPRKVINCHGRHPADDYVTHTASPVSLDLHGRCVVQTSSCCDCGPEAIRQSIDEVGNRKKLLNVRNGEKKPKATACNHSMVESDDVSRSIMSRLTNRHSARSAKSTLPSKADLPCKPEASSSNGCDWKNLQESEMSTMTSFPTTTEESMVNGSQRRGDFNLPSPPTTGVAADSRKLNGDPMVLCSSNGGSSNGGSPIYHELDPPSGTSGVDCVYKFPQSVPVLHHTYQSIAEIQAELCALRMESLESSRHFDEDIGKVSKKNSSVIEEHLVVNGIAKTSAASSSKKKKVPTATLR